jgi:hypothetical protein
MEKNTLEFSISDDCPCLLIEGPRWSDAAFHGKWLLAAAKAQALWEKADPSFKKQVDALVNMPDFNICATSLIACLYRDRVALMVPLEDWHVIMMVEMGFFVLTGQRYQMVIPAGVTMGFKRALKLAQAEDEEYIRYLEHHVAIMPYAEAKAWRARLLDMDEDQRCADRDLLLETPSDFVVQN